MGADERSTAATGWHQPRRSLAAQDRDAGNPDASHVRRRKAKQYTVLNSLLGWEKCLSHANPLHARQKVHHHTGLVKAHMECATKPRTGPLA
ncbi:hypothetical protein HaLaN_14679, partial [Haematococcus lacustris]